MTEALKGLAPATTVADDDTVCALRLRSDSAAAAGFGVLARADALSQAALLRMAASALQ